MALIATINGIPVHSDKQVTAIRNSHVAFVDGSWCDVDSGSIHNVGSGYIRVGNNQSSIQATSAFTVGPTTTSASALELSNFAADVDVEVHDGQGISYTITGPEDAVKAIRIKQTGNTLVIESDAPANGDSVSIIGNSVIRVNNRTIVSSNGRNSVFVVNGIGGKQPNPTKITLLVPRQTSISVGHVSGDVTIGDTNGSLVASTSGTASVRAGRVANVQLSVQGSGGVDILEVVGSAMIQVQGSGDVTIETGNIQSLVATLQGSGDIHVGGSAQSATLTVMGSGNINVYRVLTNPVRSVMGSGDIKVRQIG